MKFDAIFHLYEFYFSLLRLASCSYPRYFVSVTLPLLLPPITYFRTVRCSHKIWEQARENAIVPH